MGFPPRVHRMTWGVGGCVDALGLLIGVHWMTWGVGGCVNALESCSISRRPPMRSESISISGATSSFTSPPDRPVRWPTSCNFSLKSLHLARRSRGQKTQRFFFSTSSLNFSLEIRTSSILLMTQAEGSDFKAFDWSANLISVS